MQIAIGVLILLLSSCGLLAPAGNSSDADDKSAKDSVDDLCADGADACDGQDSDTAPDEKTCEWIIAESHPPQIFGTCNVTGDGKADILLEHFEPLADTLRVKDALQETKIVEFVYDAPTHIISLTDPAITPGTSVAYKISYTGGDIIQVDSKAVEGDDTGAAEHCAVGTTGMAPEGDIAATCRTFKTRSECQAFKSSDFPYQCGWGTHEPLDGNQPPSAG